MASTWAINQKKNQLIILLAITSVNISVLVDIPQFISKPISASTINVLIISCIPTKNPSQVMLCSQPDVSFFPLAIILQFKNVILPDKMHKYHKLLFTIEFIFLNNLRANEKMSLCFFNKGMKRMLSSVLAYKTRHHCGTCVQCVDVLKHFTVAQAGRSQS